MLIDIVAYALLIQVLILSFCYNEAILFKFTNAVCESYNESLITINECRLRAISRNLTTLNINATVHQSVSEVMVHAQIFKKANGYKPWLYKLTVDGCRFVKKPYNPIAILLFRFFKEFSNINHTCPYQGVVFVKDFYPQLNILPNYLPTGEYLVETQWLFSKKLTFILKNYYSFVENLN